MTAKIASTVTQTSNAFLSSLGVNSHSGTASGSYANSSLVRRSLDYLGIHLVRDNFVASGTGAEVLGALAQSGVKFDFVAPATLPGSGSNGLSSYVASLAAFRTKYNSSIAFIEGLNEVNIQPATKNGDWASSAVQFQKDLYAAVKGNASLSDLGVINLSVGVESKADYATVGDLTRYSDYANSHAYASTAGVMDTLMEKSIANAQGASSGDPVIVTEAGYTTYTPFAELGVSELAQAKMTLTAVLNSWEDGASNTFLYELLDNYVSADRVEQERHFGLFNTDGTPKLAATAVHNLTTILSYGSTGAATSNASFSIGSASSDTHVSALSKSDTVYDLLLWRDASTWDPTKKTDIEPAAKDVQIELGKLQDTVYVYDPLRGTAPVAIYHNVSQIVVALGGDPLIVEIGATSPVTETKASSAQNLTMTADQLVAGINQLAHTSGYTTINLSGDNVLKVSSLVTMKDMIANYGSVLSKVQGDYTFMVTTAASTWRKEESFDATGHSLWTKRTNYDSKGVIVNEGTVYADGSNLNAAYVGGKLSYSVMTAADKSTFTSYYDTTTGGVTNSTLRASDGSVTSRTYANSKLSKVTVAQLDGSKDTKFYNDSGQLTLSQAVDKAGNWLSINYDPATGAVLRWSAANADKSSELWVYNITGQSYSSEHQVTSAQGVVTLVERFYDDKTLAYRSVVNTDGSKSLTLYNSAGQKTEESLTASDGTFTRNLYDAAAGKQTQSSVKYADGRTVTQTFTNGIIAKWVEVAVDGKRTIKTYNASGQMTLSQTVDTAGNWTTVNLNPATGAVLQSGMAATDKSSDLWTYGITGQSYTSQHQVTNAQGVATLVERFYDDKTLAYRSVVNADGSKQTVTRTTDGTVTTASFDAVTGKQTKAVTTYADGRTVTATYTNGIIANAVDVLPDDQRIRLTYGVNGQLAQSQQVDSAKNWLTITYNPANGAVTRSHAQNADKSGDLWVYQIQGQSYSTEHQVAAPGGKVTLLERYYSNNVLAYRLSINADGSRRAVQYDSKGMKTNDNIAAADGSAIRDQYDAATGAIKSGVIAKKDGSSETYQAGITGAAYVKQHKVLDAQGNASVIERWNANDSWSYRYAKYSNGSSIAFQYDSTGHLSSQTKTVADGTTATRSFDVATGAITLDSIRYADGRKLNAVYAGGVIASIDAWSTDNIKATDFYDAAGHRTQQVIVGTDNSYQTTFYDAATGQVTKASIALADGSGENFLSGITGQNYTMQRQVLDSTGKVTLVQRWNADGTMTSSTETMADGSKDSKSYDATGHLAAETLVSASGARTAVNVDRTILGSKFSYHYGNDQLAMSEFGAAHDLLDMSRLNSGYSSTIALQNVLQSFNPDTGLNLLASSALAA